MWLFILLFNLLVFTLLAAVVFFVRDDRRTRQELKQASPPEPDLVGPWTFSVGLRRELSTSNRVTASSDKTRGIYPNGRFTEYSQGYVDAIGPPVRRPGR
jgi:hypothetical protein